MANVQLLSLLPALPTVYLANVYSEKMKSAGISVIRLRLVNLSLRKMPSVVSVYQISGGKKTNPNLIRVHSYLT